jgi:hypothetical protein
MDSAHFSRTYKEARQRFKGAAEKARAAITSYGVDVDADGDLTVDVAVMGEDGAPAVLVSSGVHGVEGFFGSAVQRALLKRFKEAASRCNVKYVLIHALNPFGFSRLRRFNENNVDLNRNFLLDGASYRGAPDGYGELDGFLNPRSKPSRFEPFRLKALWYIQRMGLQSIKQSVAGGQYEYPDGLFFGGNEASSSARLVSENCDAWLGSSPSCVHIDLHTGLGEYGAYKLLLTKDADSTDLSWYADAFGEECVEPLTDQESTAYVTPGSFGEWMEERFSDREYRYVMAEFGTYDEVRVLAALRAENRAHHYCVPESALYRSAKEELLECFCPKDPSWRSRVVSSGLKVIEQAAQSLGAK